jgi:hypothetical protein
MAKLLPSGLPVQQVDLIDYDSSHITKSLRPTQLQRVERFRGYQQAEYPGARPEFVAIASVARNCTWKFQPKILHKPFMQIVHERLGRSDIDCREVLSLE